MDFLTSFHWSKSLFIRLHHYDSDGALPQLIYAVPVKTRRPIIPLPRIVSRNGAGCFVECPPPLEARRRGASAALIARASNGARPRLLGGRVRGAGSAVVLQIPNNKKQNT